MRSRTALIVRRIALAGVLIVVISGCGGQTKTTPIVGSAPAATAASSTTTAARPLSGRVISKVAKSVLPVSCFNTDPASGLVGTGFRFRTGVVTASHVLAACPPATPFQLGAGGEGRDPPVIGSVSTNHPTHDVALVTYVWQDPQGTRDPPKPLQPESRPAHVGEQLALLGIPALGPALGDLFTLPVTVVQGTVVATDHPQMLTFANGGRETLTDAILVAARGVVPGDSGGPAIDAAGNVVGVIEGSGPGVATLTPVTDLRPLH